MRNLKRALSLAMASVMLLGMMVVGTGASYADVDSADNVEAIEVVQAVSVMVGDENGNFNPDRKVTRNEMAVIMANLLDLGIADFSGASTPFTDVPAWAAPYVAACYSDGIIAGYSATYFGGSDTVTATQAGLMVLKALGYFQYSSDFGDSWTLATVKQASKVGLYDDIDTRVDAPMTRNEVAQLVLNALEATMVETDGTPNSVVTPDGTTVNIGSVKYIDQVKGKFDKKWNAIDSDSNSDGDQIVQLGEYLFDGDLKKTSDTDDLGRPASVWTYKTEDIGKYADSPDYTFVVSNGDYGKTGLDSVLKYVQDVLDNDDFELSVKDDDAGTKAATFYANGEKGMDKVGDAMKYGTVVEIWTDDDDDDVITAVASHWYTLYQIEDVDKDVTSADSKKGVSAYVTINGTEYDDVDVAGFNAKTYVEDAYVAVIEGDDKIIDSFIPTVVEGAIESYKAGERVTMDGTKYTAVAMSYDKGDLDTTISDSLSTSKDDTYALYLDKNGYILGIDEVDATSSIDDVYYVIKVWSDDENNYGSKEDRFYAQVVDLNGVIREIELEDYYDKTEDDYSGATKSLSEMTKEEGGKTVYDFSALQDKFYTISDKKITGKDNDGATGKTLSKSGNDKYNLEAWPNADEAEDWDSSIVTFNEKLTTTLTRVSTDKGTFRLNSDTKYLVLEETGKDLDATVKTGGLSYAKADLDGARKTYIITEDDSKVAKYVVIATDSSDTANAYSDDVIFIKSDSSDKGDGFRYQDVYWADGTKETIKVDEDEYSLGRGFYTYDTNSDGFYVLDEADELAITFTANKATWDDEDGVLVDYKFVSYTDGMLTVTDGTDTIQDIDVTSGATYKDIHSTATKDGQYDKTVKSLKALNDGLEDGKFGEVKLSINVSEDGVVSVFVTDIAKATP